MTSKDELLRNDYSFKQAELIQKKYQALITNFDDGVKVEINDIKTVAGVDISYYNKEDKEFGVACAVKWNLKQGVMEDHSFNNDLVNFPYKPGFLGFRECKLLVIAISKLQKRPDLIMCDGHGKLHPRRFGEAVQLGYALDIPTIGVAKNLYMGFSTWKDIDRVKGNKIPIWLKNPEILSDYSSNEILGYAVCLKDGTKPVFISEGYKINLDVAVSVCLTTAKDHRLPEPLHLADLLSREKVKAYFS